MTLTHLLRTATFLSINQFIGQIGTIGVLALLGYYNTQLLASFNVLSANIAIFFIIATSGAVILQAEFAKLRQQAPQSKQLLTETLWLFLVIACVLYGFIFLIDPNVLIAGSGPIFEEARNSLPIVALCIPINAISAVLFTFMEAHDHAKLVAKLQIGETICMVLLVTIIVLWTDEPTLFSIMVIFVLTGIIGLGALIWAMHKKALLHFTYGKLSHIKQLIKPLRISAPAVVSQLIAQYSIFVLTAKIATLGASSSAALSTMFAFLFLSQVMVIGVCQQMSMTVAQQQAAQQPIRPMIKTTIQALLLFSMIAMACLLLAPDIVGQLVTDDPMVLPIFMQSLDITLLFCLSCFVSIFLSSLLRGLGDYFMPQVIVAMPTIGFILYIAFIKHALSFSDIFQAYLFCLGVIIIGLGIRFTYFYRRKMGV